MEVKNNHAHVTTQRILNKFIFEQIQFGRDAVYFHQDYQ